MLQNGLKKNILAMPCQAKPYTTMFLYEGKLKKLALRDPRSGEKVETGERGGETGQNIGHGPYRHPSGGNKWPRDP
jgi:hypothetical protein